VKIGSPRSTNACIRLAHPIWRASSRDPLVAAEIRAWRGESDAAFAWLDKALAARDPVLSGIKLDAYLQTLHADPRWKAVLKKIGLPTDL